MTRLRSLGAQAVDDILGVALMIAGIVAVATTPEMPGPRWLNVALSVLPGIALCARRRAPLETFVAFFVVIGVQSIWLLGPDDAGTAFLGLLYLPYALAAWTERSPWWLALPAAAITAVNLTGDGDVVVGDYLFPGGFVLASFLAGRAVRTRTRLAAELHESAILAEEAQQRATEEAIAEERRRIAREMHDVVAHSVSVMVVQAGGARRIAGRDPDRAAEAARQIERIGHDALTEMRRLLGLFHAPEDAGGRAPQPGLSGLDALVRRAREAGLPVEPDVHGERRELPSGLDLTAYRIVQEALTNAIKYGGGAEVALHYGSEHLGLRVTSGARPADAPPAAPGGGHGIVGMRERARAFGGTLHAGPTDDGGFEVRARLPLVGEEERTGHALPAEALA